MREGVAKGLLVFMVVLLLFQPREWPILEAGQPEPPPEPEPEPGPGPEPEPPPEPEPEPEPEEEDSEDDFDIPELPDPPQIVELPALLASTAALNSAMEANPSETVEAIRDIGISYTLGMSTYLGASTSWIQEVTVTAETLISQGESGEGTSGSWGSGGTGGTQGSWGLNQNSLDKVVASVLNINNMNSQLFGSMSTGLTELMGTVETIDEGIFGDFNNAVLSLDQTTNILTAFIEGEISFEEFSESQQILDNVLLDLEGYSDVINQLMWESATLSQSNNPEDIIKAQQQMNQVQMLFQQVTNLNKQYHEMQMTIIRNLRG